MSGYLAFSFNGAAGCGLSYRTPPEWADRTSVTVSFWLRARLKPNLNTWVLDIGGRTAYESLCWSLRQAAGKPLMAHCGFWDDPEYQNVFDFDPFAGKWTAIATVFDAGERTLTTYVNGEEQTGARRAFSEPSKILPRTPGRVSIAMVPGAGWQNLDGILDEIRIWDAALSPDALRADLYRRLAVPQPHLASYLNLPASFAPEMDARSLAEAQESAAALPSCRDLVTNDAVEAEAALRLVPSAVPTGGSLYLPAEGEVAVFEQAAYGGPSWRFPEHAREFDVRADLTACDVKSIRVGAHTAARLFAGPYFTDVSQEAPSDLPSLDATRLGASKKPALSLQVLTTHGRPQRGAWAIRSAAGPFLSARPAEQGRLPLRRSSRVDQEGLFRVTALPASDGHENVALESSARRAYMIAADDGAIVFRDPAIGERSRWVLVRGDDPHRFSLRTPGGRWVAGHADGGFELSDDEQAREVFTRAFDEAADESEVGELEPGDVALYEKPGYWGKAWVFHDAQADLRVVEGLAVGSVRMGPNTCVTFFDQPGLADTGNAADVVVDVPDLGATAFKGTRVASFRVWRVVSPGAIGLESVTTLSQDYRTADGRTVPYCAYRTSLSLPPNVGSVEIGVTEQTSLAIGGETRTLGAGDSWRIDAGPFSRVIATAEAAHLFTAGLKIRTDTMAPGLHVLLFPDQDTHTQLAGMEGDALWNAKDHSGQRILQDAITKDGAAQVQSAVKAMMAATEYRRTPLDVTGAPAPDGAERAGLAADATGAAWITCSRAVTSDRMDGEGWMLAFDAAAGGESRGATGGKAGTPASPTFRVLGAPEMDRLWDAAAEEPELFGIGRFFEALWNEGKKIVHVIVRKVAQIANQIAVQIRYVGEAVRHFIVSTVTQAAAVAERVFHEIVKGVRQVVEWLAFLFDWDDILATQRQLAKDILASLDFAARAVGHGRQAVDAGFEAVRAQLTASLAAVKEHVKARPLAADDKPKQSSGARSPGAEEKLHWFMSRMISPGGAELSGASAAALSLDGRPDVTKVFDELREVAGRIVDARVRETFGEALDCFGRAFSSPNGGISLDQLIVGLLSIVEGIAEVAINLVRAIVDLLFGLVEVLLSWVRTVLTAEWPIPLVKDLWHAITKGEAFSLLNVVTLAVAIPATVIRKALPARPAPPPPRAAAAVGPAAAGRGTSVEAAPADTEYEAKRDTAIAYSCFALVNGILSIPLDALGAGKMIAEAVPVNAVATKAGGAAPPVPGKPRWASFTMPGSDVCEWVCWVTQVGMLVTSWPGGYVDFTHEWFPEDDPAERWGSGLFIAEAGLAVIDLVCLASPLDRKLRRAGQVQAVVGSILGLGHLVLVFVVMGVELGHKSDWYKANVLPWTTVQGAAGAITETLAFLMLPQLTTSSGGGTLTGYLVWEGVATLADAGIALHMGNAGLIDPPEDAA